MNDAKPAAFRLERYKLPKFYIREAQQNGAKGFSLKIQPSGRYNPTSGVFFVQLEFQAREKGDDEMGEPMIDATMEAKFVFNEPVSFEAIPLYFYKNSVAIIFPYLRSFVTTLTTVAGQRPLILPILNLSSLEEEFKANISIEE